MSTFLQLTVTGLANGAVLALAALGFVLIFKSTGVLNFAQGEFLLIGAYSIFAAVSFGLPWPLAVVVALVIAVLLGFLVERAVLRPLVGESAIAVIMVTIGLAAVLRAMVQMIWGTTPRSFPAFIPETSLRVGDVLVPVNRLWAIALAVLVLLVFTLVFQRSRQGIAMRAVSDDQQAALVVGISVRRVFALAWALAAACAVLGGLLLANLVGVSGELAAFGLVVFPVVILGGLDSIAGTLVAGAVIGLLAEYTSAYVNPNLQEVVPFLVLVLILLVRPYGLFGQARIERV